MKVSKLKYICLSAALLLFALAAGAQVRVTGVVTDQNKTPMPGVGVHISGTTVGAATDGSGRYAITIPQGTTSPELVFSFIGFNTLTEPVGTRTSIDVEMSETASEIDEVVVVGYGTMRKSDITGSVSTVKIEENIAAQTGSLDQLLQGRAAGVQVTSNSFAPGAGVSITIRGTSTFNGGREPLYVVDGVILNPPTEGDGTLFSQGLSNQNSDQSTNGLLGINPQDIASMEILKDASATAIYGAMGANGVVLITTKMGTTNKTSVNYTTGVDISHRYKKLDLLDLYGYIDFIDASGRTSPLTSIFIDQTDREQGLKVAPMDWQDYVMETSVSHRHRLRVSGRTNNTNYLITGGFSDSKGIIKQTGVKVGDLRLNLDQKISKNVKIGTRTSFSRIELEMTQGTDQTRNDATSSMIKSVMTSRPFYSIYRGGSDEDDDELDEEDGFSQSSPARWLTDFNDHSIEYRVTPSIYLEAKLTPWLTYKGTVGGDYRNKERGKWKGPTINTSNERAVAARTNTTSLRYTMDHLLMFNNEFGKHRLSGTAGMTMTGTNRRVTGTEGWNINQYLPQDMGINAAPNTRFRYTMNETSILSFLVRGVYSYQDRYVLTATFRADGSSKFAVGNKYSYFPSFALAWRLTEEKWMNLPEAVSNFKLRAGWGRVGNEAISAYQTMSTYSRTLYPDHSPGNESEAQIGMAQNGFVNPSLRWETTEQYNFGIDLGFVKNRISLTVDLYDKRTKDLLQQISLPAAAGFSRGWANRGEIRNKGLEIAADALIIKSKNFKWDLAGNIAFNRNKILNLGIAATDDGMPPYFRGYDIGTSNYLKQPVNIFMEGYAVGIFWGYKTDGIVQEGETGPGISESSPTIGPGGIKYVLSEGNTVGYLTQDDMTIIGNPNPKYTYGFNTSFSYRKLSLSVAFNGVYGNQIVNANLLTETDVSRNSNIRAAAFRGAWTPDNPTNKYPSLAAYSSAETLIFTDRIVEDGSYLRLSNVTLSYDFPVKRWKAISNIAVNVSASNLYVWTKYSGWDPEVNSFGTDLMRMGVDSGSYPSARTFSFGLSVTF